MSERASIFVISVAIAFAFFVFELVRRRHLSEKYALLWILIACLVIVLAFASDALGTLAQFAGVAYPPSALFTIAIIGLLMLILQLFTVVSSLKSDVTRLLQEVAILREKIGDVESDHGDSDR